MPKVSLNWHKANASTQFDLFNAWRRFGIGLSNSAFLNPLPRLACRTISRHIPAHPTHFLPVPYLEPPHTKLHSPVGAGLLANAVYQSIYPSLTHRIREQARSHKGDAHASTIRPAVRPPRSACDFDLRRPVKPRWPSSDIDLGGKPAGRRFSRAGPWMAHRGGPPNQCRITGTPSLGEVPSGGARALWLLSRSSKVTRRQGGTLSGRDRSNGYVHTPKRATCADPNAPSLPDKLADTRTNPPPHFCTPHPLDLCVWIFAAQNFHTSSKTIPPLYFPATVPLCRQEPCAMSNQ